MHRKGLDGRPQKNLGIFYVGFRITQKMVYNSTQKSSKEGYARFGARLTFKMGRTDRNGQSDA